MIGKGGNAVGQAAGGAGWYGGYGGESSYSIELIYTGMGHGGSGYLNTSAITKGVMSVGANRGDGSAKITYIGPSGTTTSEISGKTTIDLKSLSGYYGDLIDDGN